MADGRETPRLFPGILDAFTADVTKILTRTEMQAVLADLRRKAPRSKNTRPSGGTTDHLALYCHRARITSHL